MAVAPYVSSGGAAPTVTPQAPTGLTGYVPDTPAGTPLPPQGPPISYGYNQPQQGPPMASSISGNMDAGGGSLAGYLHPDPAAATMQNQTTPVAPGDPGFMTPAMQQYVNQFNQSQSSQQQVINAGLLQALQGLGSRRDAAAKAASALPAEYQKSYVQATAAANNAARTAAAAAVGKTIGGAAIAPMIASANAGTLQANQDSQPLLQAGITADYSKGVTALDNTHMQNQAQIASQQQAFDMQQLKDAAAYQQNQNDTKQKQGYDAIMQQKQADDAAKLHTLDSNLTTQQWITEHGGSKATESDAQQQLDSRAVHFGFSDRNALQNATNDPWYATISKALSDANNGIHNGPVHGTRTAIIAQASQNDGVLRALLANGVITQPEIDAMHATNR